MKHHTSSQQKKVSPLLLAGIFFIPVVFSWFLLRTGYSQRAKIIGFGWMIAITIFTYISDNSSANKQKQSLPDIQTHNSQEKAIENSIKTSPPAKPKTELISPSVHPQEFCKLAAELGYATRAYNPSTGSCGSDYIDVSPTPGRNGLKNNISYYSMGESNNPSKLYRVSFILNINNPKEKTKAHEELAKATLLIARKILGEEPADLEKSILHGKTTSWVSGEWSIEVVNSTWPTGLGYDISVYFKPKK